jgi:hypothetical protein
MHVRVSCDQVALWFHLSSTAHPPMYHSSFDGSCASPQILLPWSTFARTSLDWNKHRAHGSSGMHDGHSGVRTLGIQPTLQVTSSDTSLFGRVWRGFGGSSFEYYSSNVEEPPKPQIFGSFGSSRLHIAFNWRWSHPASRYHGAAAQGAGAIGGAVPNTARRSTTTTAT